VVSQAQEKFKRFIHHGVFMILRLATANENRRQGARLGFLGAQKVHNSVKFARGTGRPARVE